MKYKWTGDSPVCIPYKTTKFDFRPNEVVNLPDDLTEKMKGRKGFEEMGKKEPDNKEPPKMAAEKPKKGEGE